MNKQNIELVLANAKHRFVESIDPAMSHQIGRMLRRPEMFPIYEDQKRKRGPILRYEPQGQVEVFDLLGWGSTFEEAKTVARRNLAAFAQ